MNSFGILRTNVGLTTNIKIMVDSMYNLSLDSIESNERLAIDKFKNVKFIKTNYYDELIPYFYKDLPSETAFQIKYENDNDTMADDFKNQYDELYQYGARNIIDNKNYLEEFEYFAPLYIDKSKIPSKFIIFRVDGSGLGIFSKENFYDDVVKKLKTVKIFDLGVETAIGQWLRTNFTDNKYFPDTALEIDFRSLEFCKWNGIDYETGGYTSKSLFIDDILDEEKEIFELEKFVFDSYRNNKVVYPNILNLSFLFDDEPSTMDVKRKWSLNRYFGFYVDDLELITTMSPYITSFLRSDIVIQTGNVLYSATNVDPFIEGWSDTRPFYVEYEGEYYKVEKFTEQLGNQLTQTSSGGGLVVESYQDVTATRYRIISKVNLEGKESEVNKNFGLIDSDFRLINYDLSYKTIEDFDNYDIWMIEIDGIFHNLIRFDNTIKVNTDYSFEFNENDYTYKVAGNTTKVSFVVDNNNSPKKFKIYRANLTDIKDFDTRIVDTEPSKFEYEKEDELTETDETKMYFENLSSNSNPKDLDDFVYKGDVVNIPVSSEYTSNHETFKIEKNELSDIWRKNSVYCRWGFQNSISGNDYQYLLNNSIIFEDFNRTTNTFDPEPKRIERNLDYFYTLNSSTASYLHHSLHVEKLDSNNNLDSTFKFELDKYLNVGTYSVGTGSGTYSFDYFTNFFYQKQSFLNGEINKNVKKFAEFNKGDNVIPNIALFRGIKFLIYDVESVEMDTNGDIDNINLKTSDKYDNYKLSVLLSDNDLSVNSLGNIETSANSMDWTIIDEWKMDKEYATGSVVIFNDILYTSNSYSNTVSPAKISNAVKVRTAPYNLSEWDNTTFTSLTYSIFWSPTYSNSYNSGNQRDFIFNSGEYYYCYDSLGVDDIWNPYTAHLPTGYSQGDTVLFKGKYFMSTKNNNHFPPNYRAPWLNVSVNINSPSVFNFYWVATQSVSPKWKPIQLWSKNNSYPQYDLVVHNDIVYKAISNTTSEDEPGLSTLWERKYSLVSDTNYVYKPESNAIIDLNDNYYLINSNDSNSTLDNGIVIYVNKKWKNILININVSDNTTPSLSGVDRDDIYNNIYKKFTAVNFINSINDIENKYDFTDYVTYVIIEEDGTVTRHKHDQNLSTLSCLIKCETPEDLEIKVHSLTKEKIDLPKPLKPRKRLINGNIKDINQLNYYNDVPVGVNIIENKFKPKLFNNYSGNKNILSNTIYRHSGYYMPIFYDIQLFNKGLDNTYTGNYKFDITLTDFGLIKERKIRKINRKGSILKLDNQKDTKAVYPMLQEFGYTTTDFFIFGSTWNFQYHLETILPNIRPKITIEMPTISSTVISGFGQPSIYQSQNQNNNL
jgi:hypothetical protein